MSSRTRRASSISDGEVRRLATISRLSLGPREEERIGEELSSIVDYFGTLDEARVKGATGIHGSLSVGQLREDQPRTSDPDAVLSGVPQRRGRLVRAPRVF